MKVHRRCDNTEHALCDSCDGSGQGDADGTRCWVCGGSGERPCGECVEHHERDAAAREDAEEAQR